MQWCSISQRVTIKSFHNGRILGTEINKKLRVDSKHNAQLHIKYNKLFIYFLFIS